jgi:hypothetical protein
MKFSKMFVAALMVLAMAGPLFAGDLTVDVQGALSVQNREDNLSGNFTQPVANLSGRYNFTKKFAVRASLGAGSGSGSVSNELSSPTRDMQVFEVSGSYRPSNSFEFSLGVQHSRDSMSRNRFVSSLDLSQNLNSSVNAWSPVLRGTYFAKLNGKVSLETSAALRPVVFQREASTSHENYRVNRGWASDQWSASENTNGFGAFAGVIGFYSVADNVQVGLGYGVSYLSSDAGIARFRPESDSGNRTEWQHMPLIQFRFRP